MLYRIIMLLSLLSVQGFAAEAPVTDTPVDPLTGMGQFFFMIVIIFAIFYFLLIRPQQRQQKEHERKINELKKAIAL
jgi:DNA invertase Pin-like site-specific DNA recombinase